MPTTVKIAAAHRKTTVIDKVVAIEYEPRMT
jgi:hypothetical protein